MMEYPLQTLKESKAPKGAFLFTFTSENTRIRYLADFLFPFRATTSMKEKGHALLSELRTTFYRFLG